MTSRIHLIAATLDYRRKILDGRFGKHAHAPAPPAIMELMIPLIVMALGILISRALGSLGIEWFASWKTCVRVGFAAMFLFTSAAHFTKCVRIWSESCLRSFRILKAMVTLTGWAEFAGAVGLIVSGTAKFAAYGLIALLIVLLPANVYAAPHEFTIAGRPATPLRIRVPLQAAWIALLWWAVS